MLEFNHEKIFKKLNKETNLFEDISIKDLKVGDVFLLIDYELQKDGDRVICDESLWKCKTPPTLWSKPQDYYGLEAVWIEEYSQNKELINFIFRKENE